MSHEIGIGDTGTYLYKIWLDGVICKKHLTEEVYVLENAYINVGSGKVEDSLLFHQFKSFSSVNFSNIRTKIVKRLSFKLYKVC